MPPATCECWPSSRSIEPRHPYPPSIPLSLSLALSLSVTLLLSLLVTPYSHLNSLHRFSLTIPDCHPSLILSPSPTLTLPARADQLLPQIQLQVQSEERYTGLLEGLLTGAIYKSNILGKLEEALSGMDAFYKHRLLASVPSNQASRTPATLVTGWILPPAIGRLKAKARKLKQDIRAHGVQDLMSPTDEQRYKAIILREIETAKTKHCEEMVEDEGAVNEHMLKAVDLICETQQRWSADSVVLQELLAEIFEVMCYWFV